MGSSGAHAKTTQPGRCCEMPATQTGLGLPGHLVHTQGRKDTLPCVARHAGHIHEWQPTLDDIPAVLVDSIWTASCNCIRHPGARTDCTTDTASFPSCKYYCARTHKQHAGKGGHHSPGKEACIHSPDQHPSPRQSHASRPTCA